MRTPTGSLQRAAVLVCGLLVFTACSNQPQQPGSLPSDTPSTTSSSASPTPDTPEEQVEAAVRAYYAELTRAAQTNDTSRLRTMTTKGCPCYRAVEVIEANDANGRTTPEASFVIAELRVHHIEGATASAEVRTNEAAYEVLNARSKTIGKVPRRSHSLDLSLVLEGDGEWIIANEFNLGGNA